MIIPSGKIFDIPDEEVVEVEEELEKENILFAIVKNIINGKESLFDEDGRDPEELEKTYKRLAMVINRGLSLYPDTIFQVQEMNQHLNLDGKIQYDFLFNSIKKRSRYPPKGSKWFTKIEGDNLDLVKKYFGFNTKKALKALEILTDRDLKDIKTRMDTGGVSTSKSKKEKK